MGGAMPGRIPIVDIREWLDLACVRSESARMEMFELLDAMDDAWMAAEAKRRGAASGDKGKSTTGH